MILNEFTVRRTEIILSLLRLHWVIGLIIDTRYRYMIFRDLLPFGGLQFFFTISYFLTIEVYVLMLRYSKTEKCIKEWKNMSQDHYDWYLMMLPFFFILLINYVFIF